MPTSYGRFYWGNYLTTGAKSGGVILISYVPKVPTLSGHLPLDKDLHPSGLQPFGNGSHLVAMKAFNEHVRVSTALVVVN